MKNKPSFFYTRTSFRNGLYALIVFWSCLILGSLKPISGTTFQFVIATIGYYISFYFNTKGFYFLKESFKEPYIKLRLQAVVLNAITAIPFLISVVSRITKGDYHIYYPPL